MNTFSRGAQQHARLKQGGYTIVELSIAVAIAGVLLVSAIALVQNVLQTNRANESITLISKAMAQIDKIWADQADYSGVTLANAGAANVFAGMQVTTDPTTKLVTGVSSKFNRPIWVAAASGLPASGLNKGYGITFAGIPTGVCADIVTAASNSGVRGILVTPEATPGATSTSTIAAGYYPSTMSAAGVFTVPTGTAVVQDASRSNLDITTTLGTTACGTTNSTVALSFLNWK